MVQFYTLPGYAIDDLAGQLKGFQRDGFAVIPGVIGPDEVKAARAEIDRCRAFHFDLEKGGEGATDHYKCLFNRGPYWLRFLDMRGVVDLAERILGTDCHIIGMSGWRSHPTGKAQNTEMEDGLDPGGIHVDYLPFPVKEELLVSGEVVVPAMLCTAHYYLSDVTIDLCPTWIVPGSHLAGQGPGFGRDIDKRKFLNFRGRDIQPVLVKAGDVLFFRSDVWHSGSRNRTADGIRYLLQVHYGRRMMAQKFSPYLKFQFNQEVLAVANPRQRRMLGDHAQSAYD